MPYADDGDKFDHAVRNNGPSARRYLSDDLAEEPKKPKYLPNFEIIITKDNYEISRDPSAGWKKVKRYKIFGEETERPPGVTPHFWNRFNYEDRAECLAEWEQHKKNMTYDPKTGEYTIPPAVQAPGATVPNPRTQAPTTIVCFGNEHQLNLAVEQERLGGIFESYPLDSLKQRATMRSAKDFISEHENVLLLGSFPENALVRDDFERVWRQWTSAVHTNRKCGGSFALIMPKVSEFWHTDSFVTVSYTHLTLPTIYSV